MKEQKTFVIYKVSNSKTKETKEFSTRKMVWSKARDKAIECAVQWKKESPLSKKYQGIRLDMIYGMEDDKDIRFVVTLLTGHRMHSTKIISALWEEGSALQRMGIHYNVTIMEFGLFKGAVVSEKQVTLYYFTA